MTGFHGAFRHRRPRVPDTSFFRRAACAGAPVDDFFPLAHGQPLGREGYPGLTLCRECPVRQPCLEYALGQDVNEGAWGGLIPHERRALRRWRASADEGAAS